jgi:hypothetical protein
MSVFAIAISIMLLACEDFGSNHIKQDPQSSSSFEFAEMPVMSDKVISYQRARYGSAPGFGGIVSDAETLRLWFPNDYDEQKEECNYFAIYNSTSSTGSGYLVLANDMVLYSLVPSSGEGCVHTADIFYDVILVCDDKANTFKNNINLNGSYAVPGWDCRKWETVPEKGHFPNHPPPVIPKPIMDSRVVSYQNVRNAEPQKIVTNTDTLELWFPHIFASGQAKSECNYFAMTFDHYNTYYEPVILSDYEYDSGLEYVLYSVRPGGAYGEDCKSVIKNEGLNGALLICDDEASTLRNIIKPYNTPYYWISRSLWLDPNWDCKSGIGAPEEIFF